MTVRMSHGDSWFKQSNRSYLFNVFRISKLDSQEHANDITVPEIL